MAARIADLRHAVAEYIKGTTYSFTFNVVEANWHKSELSETNFTNVFVYPSQPAGNSTDIGTRDDFVKRYLINVHLQNYLDTDSLAEEDNALQLAEELERSLVNVDMADFSFLGYTAEIRPYFEVEAAMDRNTFHSIITVEYLGVM